MAIAGNGASQIASSGWTPDDGLSSAGGFQCLGSSLSTSSISGTCWRDLSTSPYGGGTSSVNASMLILLGRGEGLGAPHICRNTNISVPSHHVSKLLVDLP